MPPIKINSVVQKKKIYMKICNICQMGEAQLDRFWLMSVRVTFHVNVYFIVLILKQIAQKVLNIHFINEFIMKQKECKRNQIFIRARCLLN